MSDSNSPVDSVAPLPGSRFAPYPFDKPGADIILRTCDGVDFRVYSHVLILASSFFETMLSLPQSQSQNEDSEAIDGCPVIPVSEDSETLETVLRICYPIDQDDPSRSLMQIEKALKAALKYDMGMPVKVLQKELIAGTDTDALRTWAIACRTGLEDAARHAARTLTDRQSLDITTLVAADLEGITAAEYFRLREFYRLRGQVDSTFQLLVPSSPYYVQLEALSRGNRDPVPKFPDMPWTDLILHSSDGNHFRVHRGLMSTVSPVLYERLRTQTGTSDVGLTSLRLEEPGDVLSTLLTMCYPNSFSVESSATSDLTRFQAVVNAAQSYQMDGLSGLLKTQWRGLAEASPLEAYFIAIRAGWMDCAKLAAKALFVRPLDGMYASQMEDMPALVYHKLALYHQSSLTAFRGVFESTSYRCRDIFQHLVESGTFTTIESGDPEATVMCKVEKLLENIVQDNHIRNQYYGGECRQFLENLRDAVKKMPGVLKELILDDVDVNRKDERHLKKKARKGRKIRR
ncbi:hypothetical protein C8Q74DRAFT_561290 [Fomes fomentarius]|nr:hypothetical protein C8Q74DRAFT_561290 [Fomes fomentarius]